jgi:hypothetical protein
MNKSHLIYVAVFLAGVILAGKVRALPVVGSKIPTV